MTVREGGHEYAPGGGESRGKDGRRYVLCGVELDGEICGKPLRAAVHQPVDPRTLRRQSRNATSPPSLAAEPHGLLSAGRDLSGRTIPEPREVKMLRLAAEAVLELPGIGWTLRQRAMEVRRACGLPVDEAPTPLAVAGAEPSRTTRPSQLGLTRWVRKSLAGAYWPIAEAALDQGFEARRSGSGHIRFTRGVQAFSLSTTVAEGRGRGFENAKAAAKRAGVKL